MHEVDISVKDLDRHKFLQKVLAQGPKKLGENKKRGKRVKGETNKPHHDTQRRTKYGKQPGSYLAS